MVKIPTDIIQVIKQFKNNIKTNVSFKKIILFGSYAKGNYSENSDIDICVITNTKSNNYLTMLKIAPKAVEIDTRIEPVAFSLKEFNDKHTFGLLKEIQNNGIEL